MAWATVISFVMKHKAAIGLSIIVLVLAIALGVRDLQLRHCRKKLTDVTKRLEASVLAHDTCEKSVDVIKGSIKNIKKDCESDKESLRAAYEFGKEERDKYQDKIDKLFSKNKNKNKEDEPVIQVEPVENEDGIFALQSEVTNFYNEVNSEWNDFADMYEGVKE